HLRLFHAGQRCYQLLRLLLHRLSHRTGGGGEHDPDRDVRAPDAYVTFWYEAKAHDVAMEVWVLDLFKRREHRFLGYLPVRGFCHFSPVFRRTERPPAL